MARHASDPLAPMPKRRSRAWLYAPYATLVVLALLWSAGWLYIRERTLRGLDEWLAAEAARGRDWTCRDRAIGGYPFRIELSCGAFALKRQGLDAEFGRLLAVSQVYQPRHVIAELGGPLKLASEAGSLDIGWRLLQASFLGAPGGFERLSISVETPNIRVAPAFGSEVTLTGDRFELHVRPDAAKAGSYQAALSAKGSVIPGLDDLIGGQEPADLDIEATANEIRDLAARPLAEEAELWRAAGGILDVTRLRLAKGLRRIEGAGRIGFDEAHRPLGQFDLATARLEGLLGTFTGGRAAAAGALIGLLTGRGPARDQPPPAARDGLQPLPPIRLANGRVQIGPIPIPGLRLPRIY